MDLRELRAFVVVADELSFTRAAHRLHIAQPPLTRQVRHLEEELGITLFVRTSRGVSLTAEGQKLLERARLMTRDAASFVELARRVKDESSGIIKVGLGWGLWEAFSRARTFHHERFPGAMLEAQDLHSDAQTEHLREGHIDVGLCWGIDDPVHINRETIFQAQIVVLMSSSSSLAQRKSVSIGDLAGETLLLPPQGRSPNSRDKALALYEAAGIVPRIMTFPSTASGIKNVIASGEGIHLGNVSPFVQPYSYHSGIATIPLNEPDATVDVVMAWRENEHSDPVLRFVATIRETFEESPVLLKEQKNNREGIFHLETIPARVHERRTEAKIRARSR